ncbi:MAG TPA: PKD domain-containing protein [Longimicrobium sp.]|nr:PKD domain-containing protein [Longimicrobium sp.]
MMPRRLGLRVPVVALLALLAACADKAPPTAVAGRAEAEPVAAPLLTHTVGSGDHIINLGIPGRAFDISEAGQVTGAASFPGTTKPRGFVWTPSGPNSTSGMVQSLPALSVRDSSYAYEINESGQVVGTSRNPQGRERAALWTPDGAGGYRVKDLGVIEYPGLHSWGAAISNAGHVVGTAQDAARAQRAFLWTPTSPGDTTGTMLNLGTLGGTRSFARGVNSNGWVVGESYTAGGLTRAFLWTPNTGMIDLGALPGSNNSTATAINEAGQIVGNSGSFGFLWTPTAPGATTGTMQSLGKLPTYLSTGSNATGLNEDGVVVGTTNMSSHYPAMIWSAEAGMRDLPMDGDFGEAYAINGQGHVAGWTQVRENGVLVGRAVIWRGVMGNVAPTAAVSVPAGAVTNHSYVLNAGGSTDPDGDALEYIWYYEKDGRVENFSGLRTPQVSFTFRETGVYTIRVVARDDDGLTDTAQASVTVEQNLAPTVTLTGGPVTVGEGVKAVLPFGVSDPNQATDSTEVSTMLYAWEWSDGRSYTGTGWRTFPDQGTYTFTLYAKDRGGLVGSVTSTVTVTNTAPTIAVHVPASTLEGATYAITASSPSDAGTADRPTLQFAFDCGRGAGYGAFSTTRAATCPALADQDTFNARAKVRDKDGAEREYVRTVRVVNARPVVQAQLADPNAPQGPVAFRFTDGGSADGPWTYRVRRGNGTYTAWMPATPGTWITTPAYTYPSGSHDEAVYVRDKDGGIGYSAPVTLVVP